MTSRRTWKVVGAGSDLRLVEFPRDNEEATATYQEAKAQAVAELEGVIAQYEQRLREIESDAFRERGKFPSLKAWAGHRVMVVASSQKRAAELLRTSVYGLRQYYRKTTGDWWYEFAREESVWVKAEEAGQYVRALSDEDARNLVRDELLRYESMGASRLSMLVGSDRVCERRCSRRIPVKVKIKFRQFDWEPDWIWVESEIRERVERPVGEDLRVAADTKNVCNWKTEGF